MKPFCQFCKTEGHWGNNCPRLKATTHGAPRVETKQLGAYETPPPRRRPLAFGPRPVSVTTPKKPPSEAKATVTPAVTAPVTKPVTVTPAVTECQNCVTLRNRIAELEHALAKAAKPAAAALTAKDRMQAYRARKKAEKANQLK